MKTGVPAPPPGHPTIAQRAAALKLASRTSSRSPRPFQSDERYSGEQHISPLFEEDDCKAVDRIPSVVSFVTPTEAISSSDEDETITTPRPNTWSLKLSKRPRFFRGKNKDRYPRKDNATSNCRAKTLFCKKMT